MKKYPLYIAFVMSAISLSGQNAGNMRILPVIPPPKMPTVPMPSYNRPPVNPHNPNELSDIQKRNRAMVEEDMASMQAEIQRQSMIKRLLESGFPSQSYQDPKGTACFYQAFHEIDSMLSGKKPLSLARTIFVTENAYYGNTLVYSDYQDIIRRKAELCNRKIRDEKLNGNNNMVKNMMLFRLLADTLKFRDAMAEKTLVHLPVKYDYDDYDSKKHFDSHFVTKLMKSGVGQCHSMPLYYLILAEATGAEAYWSLSPRHSFVKIRDERGTWYNIELTCSAILSDAHYMNSSYIKAEAIRNRLYLEPLDKKEIAAKMLVSLAWYYYNKYGMDDFYLQCLDTAGQYLDNKVEALILQSIYETVLIRDLMYLHGATNSDILLEKCPESAGHFEKRQTLYEQIDNSGYEELPEDLYAVWLRHIAKLKEKSERNKALSLNEIR
jgi:hypothetical protein